MLHNRMTRFELRLYMGLARRMAGLLMTYRFFVGDPMGRRGSVEYFVETHVAVNLPVRRSSIERDFGSSLIAANGYMCLLVRLRWILDTR